MAPTPKRKFSTARGGRRWAVRLAEFKRRLQDMDLTRKTHKRKLSAN